MTRIVFSSCHNEYLRIGKSGTPFIGASPKRFDWTMLAKLLTHFGFDIAVLDGGLISRNTLKETDIFVLGEPESHFPHTKPAKERDKQEPDNWGILKQSEINAIHEFVIEGGGLLILQEKYPQRRGNNLNDLVGIFGVTFQDDMVKCEKHYGEDHGWIYVKTISESPLFQEIDKLVYFNGCSLVVKEPSMSVAYSSEQASPPKAPLISVCNSGKGKVVVIGDATLFSEWGLGPDNEYHEGHERFVYNLFSWLTPDVYRQEGGSFSEASIQETTPGILAPIILQDVSDLSKKVSSIDEIVNKAYNEQKDQISNISKAYNEQKDQISNISKTIGQIRDKIGAGRPPVIQSILVTLSEFVIVLAGFMLGFILTKSTEPVSVMAVAALVLACIVVFLLKVIEFWKKE